MRIIYEAEDGKQFYDLISAQRHEDKLTFTEVKNIMMYNVYDEQLEINAKNFKRASKIVINDINELPLFKKKINPYGIKLAGKESEGVWIYIRLLDSGAGKWIKSRTKEEIARLVKNGNKADIYIRNGEYCALVDDEI